MKRPSEAELADTAPRRATSYDVAQMAGVSQSAVSRAFTPGASVSKRTRAKIDAAAQALGYEPNAIARILITRRSNIVAVIITEQTTLNYPDVLYQLGSELQREGFHPLLFTITREFEMSDLLSKVLNYQVDGIIACTSIPPEQIQMCAERRVPVILYNRSVRNGTASSVACDQEEHARDIAHRLVAAGHRRFLVVGGPAEAPVGNARVDGFLRGLGEKGITDVVRECGDFSYESGYDAILHADRDGDCPSAVFCANDTMALGALDALRFERGYRVPEQISVVGFDDVVGARRPTYSLTTVRQPAEQMARAAVRLVKHYLEHPGDAPQAILMPGELIVRGSAKLG